MTFKTGHIPVHTGKSTTTDPIKDIQVIQQVKQHLKDHPRNLALFTLAVNSAFRASDLLNLKHENLKHLESGCIQITTREKKTKKLRVVILNKATSDCLLVYLASKQFANANDYVFTGQRGRLQVSYFSQMIKSWIRDSTGLEGKWATHTLRKTFVYHQHFSYKVKLSTLMYSLNHSCERQVLAYMGTLSEDVASAYQNAI